MSLSRPSFLTPRLLPPPPSPPWSVPMASARQDARFQGWVVDPSQPLDRLNRVPLVDLPLLNIAYQSPYLPYKGYDLKRLMFPQNT
jgi:hypothetical protein